jgi:DNA-binding SARP family transcriptional activator
LHHGGRPVEVAASSQRVLAFVALRDRPVVRSFVAGTLWIDASEERAAANLRSALWRLNQSGLPLIRTTGRTLELAEEVRVDVRVMLAHATRVLADTSMTGGQDGDGPLGDDLLPDWYDEWVILDRERIRQLRLHMLDRLCGLLTEAGCYGRAIDVGLLAIAAEPLRESAHRAVIAAHLAEGNVTEALRQYRAYARMLDELLGIEPSASLRDLMRERVPRLEGTAVRMP